MPARAGAYKGAGTTVQSPCLVVFEQGRRWIDRLARSLRGRDVQVRHTATSSDCIARVERGCVGLIVVLGNRPAVGVELVVRAAEALGRRVPIAVIASVDQAELEMEVRDLGASLFLAEPFPDTDLNRVIARITARRGRRTAD